MAQLITTVKQRRVPAIFCESTVSDKAQRQLAKAAETRLGGTFYVDSLSSPDGPASKLLVLQRHNVDLIRCGLSGEGGPSDADRSRSDLCGLRRHEVANKAVLFKAEKY